MQQTLIGSHRLLDSPRQRLLGLDQPTQRRLGLNFRLVHIGEELREQGLSRASTLAGQRLGCLSWLASQLNARHGVHITLSRVPLLEELVRAQPYRRCALYSSVPAIRIAQLLGLLGCLRGGLHGR